MRYLTSLFAATVIVTSLVVSISTATGADRHPQLAQATPRPAAPREPAELIRMLDKDGDGKVNRSEFRNNIVMFYVEMDRNRDGHLTPDEAPGISAAAFAGMDTDKDGKVSVNEFADSEVGRFDNIDANKDGFITVDEVAAFQKKMQTK